MMYYALKWYHFKSKLLPKLAIISCLSWRFIDYKEDFKLQVLLFVDGQKNLVRLSASPDGFLHKILWDGK